MVQNGSDEVQEKNKSKLFLGLIRFNRPILGAARTSRSGKGCGRSYGQGILIYLCSYILLFSKLRLVVMTGFTSLFIVVGLLLLAAYVLFGFVLKF